MIYNDRRPEGLQITFNPPFKGSLDSETVEDSLLRITKTRKTELLFLALFLRILKTGGRAAVIVPDGVLFGSSRAHQSLRKEIVDGNKLTAVISMPSGVFKPYAGVSTAILFFTKTGAGGTDKVWFYDMKADDKEIEYTPVEYPSTLELMTKLDELNMEIGDNMEKLREMLKTE